MPTGHPPPTLASTASRSDWFNPTIQQTVMSHALWFYLDHLPGSCLLLIWRRSPAE
jgi:hypothetical protein